jgi:hypothetical protein
LATLVAGAFSSDPDKSRRQGDALHLDPDRVYGSFETMAETEARRPPDERIDFVSITTPNFLHFDVAKAFITQGFHVVCDKPMTMTVDEAETLCRLVDEHDVVFCLTHNYAGYPMVKQARALVENGELGTVRKVVVEYPQGWLATRLEETGQKQAAWRTDPPSETLALTPSTSRGTSRAFVSTASVPTSGRSSRGERWTTTPTCSFATRTARVASCTARKSRWAKKTTFGCGSTAPTPRSTGGKKPRPTSP